jgi:hypothetical protein
LSAQPDRFAALFENPLVGAMHTLSPRDFERFVAYVLRRAGYIVTEVGPHFLHGVDLEVRRPGAPEIFAGIECKRYAPNRLVEASVVRGVRERQQLTTRTRVQLSSPPATSTRKRIKWQRPDSGRCTSSMAHNSSAIFATCAARGAMTTIQLRHCLPNSLLVETSRTRTEKILPQSSPSPITRVELARQRQPIIWAQNLRGWESECS